MFQVYILERGQWVEFGSPFGDSRKIVTDQLRGQGWSKEGGTWKVRKVRGI